MPSEGPTFFEQSSRYHEAYSYTSIPEENHIPALNYQENNGYQQEPQLQLPSNHSQSQLDSSNQTASSYSGNHTQESASSILQSVKEQEAQFERLTRELEVERQSVANQLEQCPVGSTGDLTSTGSHRDDDLESFKNKLGNGGNDSSLLVDSCLRELKERGIMESEGLGLPRKQVLFHSSDQIYSASSRDYDERSDSMISSQQSYRPPMGNGMPRSQASYAINDTYANFNQLDQGSAGARDSVASDNTFNSKADGNHSDNQISDGDYIDSNAAATYMNTYNLQQSHEFRQESYRSNTTSQGSRQNSYRDHPTPNRGKLYDSRVAERPRPRSTENSLRGSSDQLAGSRGSLGGSKEFGVSGELKEFGGSRDKLTETGSRSGSHDHLNEESYPEIEEDEYLQQVRMGRLNSAFEDDNYPNQTTDSYRYPTQREQSNNYGPRTAGDYDGMNKAGSNDYIDEGEARRLFGSRHSLHDGHDPDKNWRPPDLPEVIEYLAHPNDIIKANAAAYLQHLSYGNHQVKSQTRALKGIPALIALLSHPLSEVHRNSLGALLNLSRGYENDDNKRELRVCGGLEKLTKLLETSDDNDVRELVSGILWNMSSLQELKKPVMKNCLYTIVKTVIIPNTGLQSYTLDLNESVVINWSTEFRNATGIIRNLSSDGHYARKSLRECDGLIECLLRVAQAVIGRPEMDNKPVENVVCTLRNLSYRLMEIDYPEFYDKLRAQLTAPQPKRSLSLELMPGCFGKTKQQPLNTIQYPSKTPPGRRRGEQLWQKEVVEIYLPLLSDCSNTDTLEAAVGSIQNLTACEWEPSMRIREHVRKQKGLPTVVELLGLEEADGVVCGAAIALRNLAMDKSNKTLIGKYAIRQLVSRLPTLSADMSRTSEETVRAVLATLHEVFKIVDPDSGEHARTLVNTGDGLSRLVGISKSNMKYSVKTLKGTHHVLSALWRFSGLRSSYKNKGFKESDFLNKNMTPRPGTAGTMSLSSTLTRPRSEPPSNNNTINRNSGTLRADNSEYRQQNGNGRLDDRLVDVNDPNMERNASTNTLQIQRPVQQPNEEHPYYPEQTQPPYTESYRQLETSHSYRDQFNQAHSYPDLTQSDANSRLQGYTNPALMGSFSQSREGLQLNGSSYFENSDQAAPQGEPLYARVDKRRSQTLENVPFSPHNADPQLAISLNSLNNQRTYSYQEQPDASAADSWV